ncbi:MAG: iron-containing alcohol dehydrogenase [Anaerolineales bacterium]
MRFEFATAYRVIFGVGALAEAGELAKGFGGRALIVTGSDPDRAAPLLSILKKAGLTSQVFSVPGEPTVALAKEGTRIAHEATCDLVIGFGGGSALDSGKAIAALVNNGDDPLDFLEVIGRGKPLASPPLPFIAIPTTAGTGSEVTRNAVLSSKEHRVKVSLRSREMLPLVALVDPELTFSMPPSITASTGLDALTHVIEPFLSLKRNPLTDGLCREGIRLISRSLRLAYKDSEDLEARMDMSLASLMGGFSLANAGLGAVHGFAGPLGGMFNAPHGAICAALLPHVMKVNLRAIRARGTNPDLGARFDEIGRTLTRNSDAIAEDGVSWLADLCGALEIPTLSSYGLTQSDFVGLIEKASASSSMKGNPVRLTDEEMTEILTKAL